MDAEQTCDIFLSNLKRSNLNFSLSETPFSVEIKIRKTFIKENSGIVRFSGFSSETNIVRDENRALRAAFDSRDAEIHSLKNTIFEKAKLEVSVALSDNLVKAEIAVEEVIDKKLPHNKSSFKNLKSEMNKVERAVHNFEDISENEVEIQEPNYLNVSVKNFFDPLWELKDFECDDFQNALNKHDTKINPTTSNNPKITSTYSRTPPPPFRTPPSPFSTPPPLLSKPPPPLRSPSSPQTPQTCLSPPSPLPARSTSPLLVAPAQCEHIPQCLDREPYPPRSPSSAPLAFKYFNFVRYDSSRKWKKH